MMKKLFIVSLSLLTVNYTLHAAEPQFPLHEAARIGDSASVKELLKHCNPNEKNRQGQTPLHCAAANGHYAIVQVFLADDCCLVNEKDNDGRTPLGAAVGNWHDEVAELLENDPRHKDRDGKTSLHYAAEKGRHEVVQALLANAHCNINEKDRDGFTPLHYAARYGCYEVVQVLLADSHCNHNEKDNFGMTPLRLARNNDYDNIIYLITHWNTFVNGLHISWCQSILAGTHPHPLSQAFPCNALKEVLAYLRQGTCIYRHEDIASYVAIAQLQQQEQQHPQQLQQGGGWCTIS